MIIRLARDGAVHLDAPEDFKRFKVVVEDAKKDVARARTALAKVAKLEDAATAWVAEAALRKWDGRANDRAWQDGLTAMIAKAEPYGWVDRAAGAIKAHIEWVA
jgi:HEAT repeat protein